MCNISSTLSWFRLSSAAGALVPDDVMIEMVMGDAVEAVHAGQSLLLDGFPRTMEQVGAFTLRESCFECCANSAMLFTV
jgi:adenylate kinase family enzyme